MANEKYLSLQHSELVIANMAATIFSAYVCNNSVTDANEDELIKKSAYIATKMAIHIDKTIKSDGEWKKPDEKVTPVRI